MWERSELCFALQQYIDKLLENEGTFWFKSWCNNAWLGKSNNDGNLHRHKWREMIYYTGQFANTCLKFPHNMKNTHTHTHILIQEPMQNRLTHAGG